MKTNRIVAVDMITIMTMKAVTAVTTTITKAIANVVKTKNAIVDMNTKPHGLVFFLKYATYSHFFKVMI